MVAALRNWLGEVTDAWSRFWFTPADPHTLALLRILAGGMLFYTHLVWTLDLPAFLGEHGWIDRQMSLELHADSYAWSYFWLTDSPAVIWTMHILGLIVFAAFALGFCTRVMAVLAWAATISYCHRLTGSLFGLDQVNAMLAMYLMLAPCGAVYSVDSWLRRRQSERAVTAPKPTVSTNIATRLIQIHMCVIYLFGGIGKMRGELWWDGSAVWFAAALLEYQSLDITWIVQWRWLVALLTHVTVFWETFYFALVWWRVTRPVALLIAVGVHGGIAVALGMITFGLAMIFGNMAFLPPELVRRAVDRLKSLCQGRGGAAVAEGA